jgi:hypothetical protein
MIRRILRPGMAALAVACLAAPAAAQTHTSADPVIQAIWEEGTDRSQVYELAQILLDSIGPRLTASPAATAASDWVMHMYDSWGIESRRENYGTWRSWRRGITHIDLLEPRVRSLEGMMLAWSPGTDGPVTAPALALPDLQTPADLEAFLAEAEGKFVLLGPPEMTCRPNSNWEEYATPESYQDMLDRRQAYQEAYIARFERTGVGPAEMAGLVEDAGAVGILSSNWSRGWGVNKVFRAGTRAIPQLDVSCEDYGLVFRLSENDQGPVIRVDAQSEDLGDQPVFNTIGVLPGTELPDEYVLLSAHFDSWDGGSGATDNGTGTVTMMEAMRILSEVYPNPRRTILVGLWEGEEQGLNGSRAFAADHPEVVEGLQALFNQDNGTGRVTNISMQGLSGAAAHFGNWLAQVPTDISRHIQLRIPGTPGGGGSDYASFVCAGAPAFSLSSLSWEYGTYTWHTQRDTFDKVVIDEVTNNAVLTAMLAYLASEDPERVPRDRAVMPMNPRTGEQRTWPECRDATRSSEGYFGR